MATDTSVIARDLIFISYSHRDKKWLDRLLVFLKPYIRQGRLNVWADPYVQVGDRWEREISTGLARTCVGVLLVSQEFLASDFIQEQELPPLIRGAETGSIILFAIAISASTFKITPLAQYQWANSPTQPLDDLPRSKRNAVFVHIVNEIEKAVARAAPAPALQPTAPPMRKTLPASLETVAVTHRTAKRHGLPSQRPNYIRRETISSP